MEWIDAVATKKSISPRTRVAAMNRIHQYLSTLTFRIKGEPGYDQ